MSAGKIRLDIGPWRDWITRVAREFDDEESFAAWLGVDSRRVRAWLRENDTIHIDQADRVLTNARMPHVLNELWPLEDAA